LFAGNAALNAECRARRRFQSWNERLFSFSNPL
jgi:hypothetical protein